MSNSKQRKKSTENREKDKLKVERRNAYERTEKLMTK